jgi:hypothetical protein
MKRRRITVVVVSFLLLIVIGMQNQAELGSDFLVKELSTLKSYIEYQDIINPAVSEASVAWHLDHILLVINGIYQRMDSSDVHKYNRTFSFSRTLVFTTNRIPRGRAESPKSVRPKDEINLVDIQEHLKLAEQSIKKIDSLAENAFFEHPYFGKLNRKQARKFLKIHTNHHLNIVKDILRK